MPNRKKKQFKIYSKFNQVRTKFKNVSRSELNLLMNDKITTEREHMDELQRMEKENASLLKEDRHLLSKVNLLYTSVIPHLY